MTDFKPDIGVLTDENGNPKGFEIDLDSIDRGKLPECLKDKPPSIDDIPDYCTVSELAALLRTSRKTVYNLLERENIPGARKVGRAWKISVDAFRRWYEQAPDSDD